ncbi:antibiotic biosynthesis monooxygenase family protein [Arthrobacter sp. NPDC093128]|uniref:antibiotic biosynthesis monooxygenase family protein n=1 Tax=Arthrobacter sp. NPDC093128 TaxID=3154979 RepID=UPI003426ADBE
MAGHYASGVWHVRQGNDEQFVQKWTEFLQWSRENYPSMVVARLLHDKGVPGRYMSYSEWTDESSRDAWKQDPEFRTRFGARVFVHIMGPKGARNSDYLDKNSTATSLA